MTTNQLRYWELRWKQWYEYQLLQHKKAELAEQKRATRVKEKQEYARITIDREDLDRKWDELTEKKRAAIVGEALRKYEADINLMNVSSMAEQRLQQMKTVAADLYLQYTKAEDEAQRKWYEAYAEAANKGWGQGAFYAAYEMADKSNLISQGKQDMLEVFNSIPGFKVPNSTGNSNGSTKSYSNTPTGRISAEVPNNKGILAVTKSSPSTTKLSKVIGYVDKVRGKVEEALDPYLSMRAAQKRSAGTNYIPIDRDSYKSSPQTDVTKQNGPGSITTLTHGSRESGPTINRTNSGSRSGSIITTNIHKGPGY